MTQLVRPALTLLALFTLLTGALYPAVVTMVAQALWPGRASGSLVYDGERAVGSEWIGQPFDGPGFFWSRPSSTGAHPYDARASTGSNLGPSNPKWKQLVDERLAAWRAAHPQQRGPVPVELVTASGSGLDPHLSPAGALYQVERVAAERGLAPEVVRRLVEENTEGRTFAVLGEPRVNVLRLNLAVRAFAAAPAAP